MWEVIFQQEFGEEFRAFGDAARFAILSKLQVLRVAGPNLSRPHVDTIQGSAYPNMKELRVQVGGRPWRVLFAFDPARRAVLLVGGDKAGDKRWYRRVVAVADDRFRRHLEEA